MLAAIACVFLSTTLALLVNDYTTWGGEEFNDAPY